MAKKAGMKVKYILNPGDMKDVETFVGTIATKKTIATSAIREAMRRYEEAKKADSLARIYSVTYAGRKLIVEEFYPALDRFEVLEEEERLHIPNKVLEHFR